MCVNTNIYAAKLSKINYIDKISGDYFSIKSLDTDYQKQWQAWQYQICKKTSYCNMKIQLNHLKRRLNRR